MTLVISCKNVFRFFYYKKRVFSIFLFFHFSAAKFVILVNLLNSEIKRVSSYGFNRATITNSLTKRHNSQTWGVVGLVMAFGALGAEGRWFQSHSGKSFTCSSLYDVMWLNSTPVIACYQCSL